MLSRVDWNALKKTNYPKIAALELPFKHYEKEYYQIGPCEYAWVDRDTVCAFYWAPCEGAFRRMAFCENVFCIEASVAPPQELLLSPDCLRYDEILAEARSGRFRSHFEMSPRDNFTGFPDASIGVERITYHFRAERGLDPAETVYAVKVSATDDGWRTIVVGRNASPLDGGK